ncbi:potassium channel beta subunit family protein [Sphingobacterium spiritivorum]|uniref:Voltage-dependent potassium channel beta subunit n=1 Tax=Sphingobacterium spiritivorum ATCC 33861 TaxID=525373 RepID=D7VNI5_SPHSI|nr:aldo/keto reductase [Sphingobacterium spiritivorum]EFK57482.1 voltage-dependent potassium channel beta subunit [Sphingobacterium spiritivorum ATCC 33861]QQT36450.1 aldo/keto reductase [Sphingobacterium spiritivorum]WQD33200.1 aldo/keto reductase [Sphingobacterium spiritivorum]SUJ19393.1 L-glyceraldehyde 3-phosphate reductase [Sphingobacterium spiritivorum]
MEYRRMGKTGLQLSVLSFGSWVTFARQTDDQQNDRLMSLAYDAGINFFDNAEVYSNGLSEEMMGRILKQKDWDRSSYVVSSKAFFGWKGADKKPNQHGLSRKHLTEACHEALTRLQVEYLDLYYCHRPDKNVPVEEVVRTMNTLIQQGKILYWGTSEWSAAEIVEAHAAAGRLGLEAPAVEQPEYNLFNRQKMEADYLTIFKNLGMGTTIWSPLASGLLTGKYNNGIPEDSRLALEGYGWLKDRALAQDKLNRVEELGKLAVQLGVSLPTLAIAWCVRNPNVTTAILGATKESQLLENLKALEVLPLLTPEVLTQINDIMQTKPFVSEY